MRAGTRHGANDLARLCGCQEGLKLQHVIRKAFRCHGIAAERAQRGAVGARCTAKAQVDAAGKQRGERSELLGDDEGRMVGQHDAAGADADGAGVRGNVADDHRGGGTGDAFHVVVLRHPEAGVTQCFDVLGQRCTLLQRLAGGETLAHRHEVENGTCRHGAHGNVLK